MLRFIQAILVIAVVLGVLPRREPRSLAPEPPRPPQQGISYTQLKRLVVGIVFLILGLWLTGWFISRTSEVLTLLVISTILAISIAPAVDVMTAGRLPLADRPMPRAAAILLLYLVLAVVAAGIGLLIVPQLVAEAQNLVANAPQYANDFSQFIDRLEQYPFVPKIGSIQDQIASSLAGGLSQFTGLFALAVNVASGLVSIGLVMVITFFLLMEARSLRDHLISLLPPSRQGSAREMGAKMARKITGWMAGIILLSASVGVGTCLGMWLLGMPFPLLLGLTAGLFEFVPMIGPYLGAAPAVILAAFMPTWKLVAVIIFFVLLQQIENNVLSPTIMGRQVEMPPLLVIIALLLGGALMGIVGALLAVPVAAVVQVLWTDLVVPEIRRQYQEGGERPPGGNGNRPEPQGLPAPDARPGEEGPHPIRD